MTLAGRTATKSTRTAKKRSEKSENGKIFSIDGDYNTDDLLWRAATVIGIVSNLEIVSSGYNPNVLTSS